MSAEAQVMCRLAIFGVYQTCSVNMRNPRESLHNRASPIFQKPNVFLHNPHFVWSFKNVGMHCICPEAACDAEQMSLQT